MSERAQSQTMTANARETCDWCGAVLRMRASLARAQGAAEAEALCGRCYGAYRAAVGQARAEARRPQPGGPGNGEPPGGPNRG